MLVEYEKSWLEARIVKFYRGIEDVLVERLWMNLGEISYNSSVENVQPTTSHHQEIEKAIRSFVPSNVTENLKGVIIGGEASAPGQTALRDSILHALPQLVTTKILDSTDPFYLGAAGAGPIISPWIQFGRMNQ
ncbi:uncharacterized protein K444DRAFT_667259 [Hyaloscypha bicolor E]|uniref:Uncharacterized protein n=1 Tax=Hyaloscypha bicolor E TaxID=1095630 RepID=A0A2J6SUX3_9HELO|nr:uncharacterized protein K444DRAFT_667259 [Hyaloscypha bicolor E]PMD54576.1 hypothetical protein K444DRAFT_667259 [Hyaloscypha bicolor E]